MQYRVLISAPYVQRDIKKLDHIFARYNIDISLPKVKERLSEKELLPIINRYDGVICGDDAFTKKVLDKAKRLKVIVKWGTGVDSIDLEYAKKLKIPVCNTPGAFTQPVSDTVMGFILAFARNIVKSNNSMKRKGWRKFLGVSLSKRTLGIIGVGNIGQMVAQKAHVFGMKILGNDIRKISGRITRKYGIHMVDKPTLFRNSDFISLNCTLNKSSYHLVTLKELKLMKNSAVIINTARGPLIKERDLVVALREKIIAGAALDVFEKEPLPKNSFLRRLDNVLLSPHNANSSPYYWQKVHENSIKKLLKALK